MLRNHLGQILVIILLIFATYSFSLTNNFVWDDETQIVGNTFIHNINNLPQLLTGGIVNNLGNTLGGGFYRPVLTLSHMLLYAISTKPFVFRLFQITIHILNTILVFVIFYKLFLIKYKEKLSSQIALVSALIFGLHPGISEGVLFISGLGEPLFTFFTLTAFFFFLESKYFICGICFFLGLLTKETAVVFLPLIALYEFLFSKNKYKINKLLIPTIFLFVYLILRYLGVGFLADGLKFPAPIAQAPLTQRLFTIPYEIIYYLSLFIFPLNLSISQHKVIAFPSNMNFIIPLVILVFLIIGLYIIYKKIKLKLFLFFVGLFILGLLPALNIIPLASTVAERWLYFPLIGLTGALAVSVVHLNSRLKINNKIVIVLLVVYLSLFSLRTFLRTLDWQNGLTLYSHDIKVNPESFELVNNYGVELFRKGQIGEAKKYFEKSILLSPNWWTNYNNLGVIYEREGDLDKAKENYQKAIENGNYSLAYENLANILVKTKDYQNANVFLEKAVLYFPNSVTLHKLYAISLYAVGDREEALKEAKTVYNLNPTAENLSLFNLILNKEKLTL